MKVRKAVVFLVALAALAWAAEADQLPVPADGPGSEEPNVHGMLVFGGETIYVSHLPMFTLPHRYQGIWEVTFGESSDATYRKARIQPQNLGGLFTLSPTERFRLPVLTEGKTSFTANVFVGHFERPGRQLLLPDVTVNLRRLVHFHPFLHSDQRPSALTYILFGKGREFFLAHRVSLAPNYDQILGLGPMRGIDDLPAGATLTVPGRNDSDRLQAKELVSAVLVAGDGVEPSFKRPMEVRPSSQLYLEEDELRDDELPLLP